MKEYIAATAEMIQHDYEDGKITEEQYHDALNVLACVLTGMN